MLVIFCIFSLVISKQAEAQDDHGNTRATATAIATDGTLVSGNIETPGDLDWFSFSAVSGYTYVIETSDLGSGCDTFLYLASATGSTAIASDDDGGVGVASKIEWQATSSDTYYVAVEHFSTSGTGTYKISLTSNTPTYDATGTWTYSTSNNWVNPGTAGCTVEANETVTVTMTQTGTNVEVVIKGETYTGTVSGATYTGTASYPEEGGTTTTTVTFTLSSSTSGSGTVVWSWTDGSESCNGGSDISLTKSAVAAPSGGGGGGGGCFIATAADGTLIPITLLFVIVLSGVMVLKRKPGL
jgi:hypothetical protein